MMSVITSDVAAADGRTVPTGQPADGFSGANDDICRADDPDDETGGDEQLGEPAGPRPPLARVRHADRARLIRGRMVQPHVAASFLVLAAFLVATARNCHTLWEAGHDWGDDFALYVRQAKALVEGNPGQVVADTRFAVTESGWAFSPNAYPWGWPILLAPGVLLFGLNYTMLKWFPTAMLLLSFALLHRFVARRTGHLGALALLVLFGTNMFYLGWTNMILSEFAFFASALMTLLALDRYRTTGAFLNNARQPAVLAGLALAWTMNVRREGAGLLLGLFALQCIELWAERRNPAIRSIPWRALGKRLAVPYVAFFGSIVAFQLLLPTDLLPNAGKSGLQNLRQNLHVYRLYLAEHLGLKDPGDHPLRWFHDSSVGSTVFLVVLTLAVAGIVLRCIVAPRLDGWLVGGLLGHAYIVLAAPFSDGRYLYALSPWVAYFTIQAVPSFVVVMGRLRRRLTVSEHATTAPAPGAWIHAARALAAAGIVCLAVSNLPGLKNALAYHRAYSYIENGPDSVAAVEMFANVSTRTRPNDVILFFRARAMMLYVDRRAVQNGDLKRMSGIADWYVMAKNSTYGQQLVTEQEAAPLGLTLDWQNSEWVLWRIVHPQPSSPVVVPTPIVDAMVGSTTAPDPSTQPSVTTPTIP